MKKPHCKCVAGEYEYLPVNGVVGTDETCAECPYAC